MATGIPAKCEVKVAIVPGGEPKPDALLVLAEAKLFELKNVALLERAEIDKVLAEQKLSGMFSATNAVELGQILKVDLFAVLETTSIVIFDAQTGLRLIDETLPENIETAAQVVAEAVTTAVEKRQKLDAGKLVTFGVLEVRNADFPVERDAWCRAVAGMLERSLLHRGGAVLERSRLQLVNRERSLAGDGSNDLLASMKLIDLEFTRGQTTQSFRITARIGDQTYRAESPIDQPLDTVQSIAGQLLKSKVVTEISREAEAARYAKEARINMQGDALDKIEVAVALQSENPRYRKQLYEILSGQTYLSLYQLGFIVDADFMREAFQNLLRLEGLKASLPPGTISAPTDIPVNLLRCELIKAANQRYPEYKDDLRALNRRILDRWLNDIYRPAFHRVVDQTTYKEYLGEQNPPYPQETADLAVIYAEMMENTLRLSRQYGMVDRETNNFIYRFTEVLRNFAKYVMVCRFENLAETNPEAAACVERTLVLMEHDPRLTVHIYAWIARNRPIKELTPCSVDFEPTGYTFTLSFSQPHTRDYFEKLRSYISSLPQGLAFPESNLLYTELTEGVISQTITNPRFTNLPHLAKVIVLADSRNEFVGNVIERFISEMNVARRQNVTEYMPLKPQIDPVIRRQITLAEAGHLNVEPSVLINVKNIAVANGIMAGSRNNDVIRPWTSEIKLSMASREEGFHVQPTGYVHPMGLVFRGDWLCYVLRSSASYPDNYFIGCVNLQTLEKRRIPFHDYSGYDIQYVDKDNVYYSGSRSRGLDVYPLDGSKPWSLTTDDGLPSANIRVLGTLDDHCYAAIGTHYKTGEWIIRIDLKTRQWEMLSSNRAKEGKTPFVDGKELTEFTTLDVPQQERLILKEDHGIYNLEFWTIEKDGQFVPITVSDPPDRFEDGRELLLFKAGGTAHFYDTTTSTLSRSNLGIGTDVDFCCAWNGYVWGSFAYENSSDRRWARQRLGNDSEIELLAVPEAFSPQEPSRWCPFLCAPTPDGKGIVVCDEGNIVILRF